MTEDEFENGETDPEEVSEQGRFLVDGSAMKHVIHYGDITTPIDFPSTFDLSKPIEIDIGCGLGRFILARAQENPDIQYVGVERLLPRVRKIDKKATRLGLKNLFLIRLEATYTLQYLLPEHSISRFYLFFPDPWPKRRHARHRIFNADFRSLVWSRLVPNGELQVATDSLDYFADMERQMADDARFERVPAMERKPEEQTDFERIFRAKGQPIGAGGYRARTADEIGTETLARYAKEDEDRQRYYWEHEMPHDEPDEDGGDDENASGDSRADVEQAAEAEERDGEDR